MIEYTVSTVDRYDSGPLSGQLVLDSAWSCDFRTNAGSVEEAIKNEILWIINAIADGPRYESLVGVDARRGLVWWEDIDGDEIVTELSIDLVEEV